MGRESERWLVSLKRPCSYLVCLVSWFVWFLSFFEPNQPNKQDKPNKLNIRDRPTIRDVPGSSEGHQKFGLR